MLGSSPILEIRPMQTQLVPTTGGSLRRIRLPVLIVIAGLAAASLGHTSLERHARPALLISQAFPQIPFKPLELVSAEPTHELVELASTRGTVIADVFLPAQGTAAAAPHARPALILAMGVKTAPRDQPLLRELGRTFARLGMVVLWPRRE